MGRTIGAAVGALIFILFAARFTPSAAAAPVVSRAAAVQPQPVPAAVARPSDAPRVASRR
ncbi:MAG TPA: hypothetical protein VFX12_08575 [Vicinamibacterales bacterium]|nr:hypothetical protein [Vicinamibacterales bacterium]